jgi:organic radical activating enzyme
VDYVCEVLREGKDLGFSHLRLTGGGEPLMYKHISAVITTANFYNYDISIQTNGDKLSLLPQQLCSDIRVSLGDGLPFPPKNNCSPTGYNYVVTSHPDYDLLNRVIKKAISKKQYVRVVTDDTDSKNTPTIEDIRQHISTNNGMITFHDGKVSHKGKKHCPSPHVLLAADGFWYPCCRTQYSKGKNLTDYDETMRLGKQFAPLSEVTSQRYNGRKCVRCYY